MGAGRRQKASIYVGSTGGDLPGRRQKASEAPRQRSSVLIYMGSDPHESKSAATMGKHSMSHIKSL